MIDQSNVIGADAYFPGGFSPAGIPDVTGIDGQQIYEEVVKAITSDATLPRAAGPSAARLGVEFLDATLRYAETQERQLWAWKDIKKVPTGSLAVEWSRVNHLGGYGTDGFIGATDAGIVTDPNFSRGVKEVKYLAVKGQVALVAQLQRSVGFNGIGQNIMATAEMLKTRELLRHAETMLFFADSTISSLHFDGWFKQISDAATEQNEIAIDMEGNPLNKDVLEVMTDIMANNHADPNRVYVPNVGLSDLKRSLFPQVRMGENVRDGEIGSRFIEFLIDALNGDPEYMKIRRTHMLTPGVNGGLPRFIPTVVGDSAPAAPAAVAGVAGAHVATSSRPGLRAGTYVYTVCAVSRGGYSLGTTSGAVAPTAGQRVTLSITHPDQNVLYFYVFRNKTGEDGTVQANRKYLCRVARTGAVSTFVDDRFWEPDTYQAGVFQQDDESYVAQYLPLTKRPLPQDLMANAFGLLLFVTPIMTVPTHNIWLKNCGRLARTGKGSVAA